MAFRLPDGMDVEEMKRLLALHSALVAAVNESDQGFELRQLNAQAQAIWKNNREDPFTSLAETTLLTVRNAFFDASTLRLMKLFKSRGPNGTVEVHRDLDPAVRNKGDVVRMDGVNPGTSGTAGLVRGTAQAVA